MSCQDVSVPTLCQDFLRLSGQSYILYPYVADRYLDTFKDIKPAWPVGLS